MLDTHISHTPTHAHPTLPLIQAACTFNTSIHTAQVAARRLGTERRRRKNGARRTESVSQGRSDGTRTALINEGVNRFHADLTRENSQR